MATVPGRSSARVCRALHIARFRLMRCVSIRAGSLRLLDLVTDVRSRAYTVSIRACSRWFCNLVADLKSRFFICRFLDDCFDWRYGNLNNGNGILRSLSGTLDLSITGNAKTSSAANKLPLTGWLRCEFFSWSTFKGAFDNRPRPSGRLLKNRSEQRSFRWGVARQWPGLELARSTTFVCKQKNSLNIIELNYHVMSMVKVDFQQNLSSLPDVVSLQFLLGTSRHKIIWKIWLALFADQVRKWLATART